MAAGFRGVVFDFDFTLADASAGIIPAVNGALGDIGLPQLDEARVRAIIGLSLPAVLEELTGITEPPELVDKFAARFIERADSLEDASGGAALSTVLPGVALALAALRAAGLRIAIASTKGRERIAELLQIHGLHGMFDALVGAEDVPDGRLKPEPDALLEAAVSHANVVPCRLLPAACCLRYCCHTVRSRNPPDLKQAHRPPPVSAFRSVLGQSRLELKAGEILYCGDHVVDALAAGRAGVGGFIGVLTGTHNPFTYDAFVVNRYK